MLRLLGLLVLLVVCASVWPGPGWAQDQGAAAVADSYVIRSFEPGSTRAGPDPTTCWGDLAVGDTITVAAAGSGTLTLTLPAGWTWQLERKPGRHPDPAVLSSWTGTDEDHLVRWAGSSLDFTGGLIYVVLDYGLDSSANYCTANLVAERPFDSGDGETPTGEQLGVSLACQHEFGEPGRVECTATPTQAADGYDWWFDGTPQTAATGPELLMSDVPPGSHTVSVVARDTVNGLTSAPDTLTFTTAAPDDGGGLPPLPTIPLLPLLVGAGALAAGGAVLAARKLRHPAAAGVPIPAGAGPLGAPMPAGMPRSPAAPPESLAVPPSKPRRPPQRLPEPLRGGATPAAAKPAPARPARSPARQQPVQAPATRRRMRQSTFWLVAAPSQILVTGNGRDDFVVSVRAFRRVDGAVTDVTAELTAVSGTSSNEKKIRVRKLPGTDNHAVRGTHVGTADFTGSVTIDGTSSRGEHAQATVQVTVVHATWEVQITAEKAGFRGAPVEMNLRHACARIHGSVVTDGLAGLSAFAGHVPDGPVVDARCTASMRVDTVPWSSPRAVHTGPDGSFWFAIPDSVLSVFGVDDADYVVRRRIKLGADDEVKQLLHGYDVALQDFVTDLKSPEGPPYGDVIRNCKEYPARFLEQLRTGANDEHIRRLGAAHLLRASLMFQRLHRRDFRQQRGMLNLAGKDLFERALDVFTDVIPVAAWMLGDPFEFRGRKVPGLPTVLRNLDAWLDKKANEAWLSKFVFTGLQKLLLLFQAVFAGIAIAAHKLADLLEELSLSMLARARNLGRPVDGLERSVDTLRRARREADDPRAEGLGGALITVARLIVTAVTFVVQVLIWLFVMVAIESAMALTIVLGVARGHEGAKATWGEQFEELLGDLAKKMYGAVGWFLEGLQSVLPGPLHDEAAATAMAERDLNEVVMDLVASIDDLDKRCAPALVAAHQDSLALRVPADWRRRLKQAIQDESEQQHQRQELYTKNVRSNGAGVELAQWMEDLRGGHEDVGSYGAFQWLEWVDRWAKLLVRIVQGLCFVVAMWQDVMARLLLEGVNDATPTEDAAMRTAGSEARKTKAKGATEFSGTVEKLADIASLVFIRGFIFGLELDHLLDILIRSPKRVVELYGHE